MPAFFLSLPGVMAGVGVVALVVQGLIQRPAGAARRAAPDPSTSAVVMRTVLSLVVVGAALYVILFKPDAPDDHKWAYSAITFVLGFWLRSV
jgi:hypothetical protein